MKILFGIALAASLLGGCDILDNSCDDKIEGARDGFGPESSRASSSGAGWNSITLFWSGISRSETFVWGDTVDRCQTSVTTLSPF